MKKFLTVYNVKSGIHNITANLLIQSISRGTSRILGVSCPEIYKRYPIDLVSVACR
jgi:hypothetical protein